MVEKYFNWKFKTINGNKKRYSLKNFRMGIHLKKADSVGKKGIFYITDFRNKR
jgi:hypothetical protein